MASSSGWTAGAVHHGPPKPERAEKPKHVVRMTVTGTRLHPAHYATADEAISERMRRLRDSGITFERDGMSLTFHDQGQRVVLEYLQPGEF